MQKTLALKIVALCLVCSLLTGIAVYASIPTDIMTLGGGVYPGSPAYTVYEVDGSFYCKDGNGVNQFSGVNPTDVINDGIDDLSITGGKILIVNGLYEIDEPLTIVSQSNIWIEGEGNTILKAVSGDADNLISFNTGTNGGIKNIIIDGNALIHSFIKFSTWSQGWVLNCIFKNSYSVGIGGAILLNPNCHYIYIDGNYFYDIDENAVEVNAISGGNTYVSITNNMVEAGRHGFTVEQVGNEYLTISNNIIQSVSYFGIFLDDALYTTITGNIIRYSGAQGIYLNNADENVITGNFIVGNGDNAVYFATSNDNTLVANRIIGNVTDTGDDNIIEHNNGYTPP